MIIIIGLMAATILLRCHACKKYLLCDIISSLLTPSLACFLPCLRNKEELKESRAHGAVNRNNGFVDYLCIVKFLKMYSYLAQLGLTTGWLAYKSS